MVVSHRILYSGECLVEGLVGDYKQDNNNGGVGWYMAISGALQYSIAAVSTILVAMLRFNSVINCHIDHNQITQNVS